MMNYIGIDGRLHNNTLQHHGVLGMKWGVRRDRQREARRSLNKLARLEKKRQKNQLKSAKYQIKAAKKQKKIAKTAKKSNFIMDNTGLGANQRRKYTTRQMQASKYQQKAAKYSRREAVYTEKAIKWANNMNKHIGNQPVSGLSQKQIYAGRKYCVRLAG